MASKTSSGDWSTENTMVKSLLFMALFPFVLFSRSRRLSISNARERALVLLGTLVPDSAHLLRHRVGEDLLVGALDAREQLLRDLSGARLRHVEVPDHVR